MMSKGVVAAEELRRQLGEALPGANELMVKAYNRLHPQQEITNRQFTKMQEDIHSHRSTWSINKWHETKATTS